MMTQSEKTKARDDFVRAEAAAIGWTEEQVKQVLREDFGRFNPDMIARYRVHIRRIVWEREEANPEQPRRMPDPQVCPYHPEVMVIGAGKIGTYTRTPEWTCPTGGKHCFNMWKMDKMLARIGTKANWSVLDGDIETLIRGKIEAQS